MENENRLIYANALKDALRTNDGAKALGHSIYKLFAVDEIIDQMPAVDAEEVMHGYWINGYNVNSKNNIVEHTIDCSVCDSVFKDKSRGVVEYWKEQFKVCPFCGARMDLEVKVNDKS